MHHGTLLFDSNTSVLAGALQVDKEKTQAKGIKPVRSRVTNTRPLLPRDMTLAEFRKVLLESILEQLPGTEYTLTEADLAEVAARKQRRYDTWEWNYGHSPACSFSKKARFEGCGSIEAFISLDQGRIQAVEFRGDFFAAQDPAELAERLTGCVPDAVSLEAALADTDVSRYFMGLSKEQFLSLLC